MAESIQAKAGKTLHITGFTTGLKELALDRDITLYRGANYLIYGVMYRVLSIQNTSVFIEGI
jgi:hypothetical protein